MVRELPPLTAEAGEVCMVEQVTEPSVQGWQIETKGIGWIEDDERHGTPRQLFWPWTAANVSFFTISYGVFVIGLGLNWWQAAIAVVVGVALSYPFVGMLAIAGVRGSAPT